MTLRRRYDAQHRDASGSDPHSCRPTCLSYAARASPGERASSGQGSGSTHQSIGSAVRVWHVLLWCAAASLRSGYEGVGIVMEADTLAPGQRVWFSCDAGMKPGDGSMALYCVIDEPAA